MSNVNLARRTTAQIFFAGVDITDSIQKYLLSITYTDSEEDESDDLQIKIQDRGDVWMLEWLNSIIQAAASGTKVTETTNAKTYKVNVKKRLNVRAGPGGSYPVIGKFTNGKKITVYEISNGWARIVYSQRTGYVHEKYIRYVADVSSSSSAAVDNIAKGLRIQAVFVRQNWHDDGADNVLDCGEFELDSIDASGPPTSITIKGTALPFDATIRQTQKTQAWEGYTLSGIANEMASKNDMACLYESAYDPLFERVEQVATSDIAFLSMLCHNAGISLKITNNILVLFDQAKYESAPPVLTIQHGSAGGYTKYKLGTGEADALYASCHVSYINPSNGKVIEATVYSDEYSAGSKNNQCLEITAAVKSIAEADLLARKMLRLHNKYEYTGSFTFPGNPELAAGMTVQLSGWGLYDGKYSISRAKHQIAGSGYTTTIDVRRVLGSVDMVVSGTAYKVSASSTAVRTGPAKAFKKIGTLKKGKEVMVLGNKGTWSIITYKERTSYVYTNHLKK